MRRRALTYKPHHIALFFVACVVVLAVAYVAFSHARQSKASVAVFYPKTCLGGWQSVENATGKPQVIDGNVRLFTEANSAVLRDKLSQIYCGGFEGQIPSESNPTGVKIKFSLAVKSKFEDAHVEITDPNEDFTQPATSTASTTTSANTSESTTTSVTKSDADTQQPAASSSVTAETTSTDSAPVGSASAAPTNTATNDTQPAASTDSPVVSAPSESSTPAPTASTSIDPVVSILDWMTLKPLRNSLAAAITSTLGIDSQETNAFEVSYTLDGQEWKTLGKVPSSELEGMQFEIPLSAFTSWDDLSKLQISVKSPETFDETVDVYLDGMSLEVEYASLSQKVTKEDDVHFNEGERLKLIKKDFKAGEDVKIKINPNEITAPVLDTKDAPATSNSTSSQSQSTQPQATSTEPSVVPEATSSPITLDMSARPTFFARVRALIGAAAPKAFAQNVQAALLKAQVKDAKGNVVNVQPHLETTADGTFIKIPKPGRYFKPGVYSVSVEVNSNGSTYTSTEQFTWGVLAINLNKSEYQVGEKGYIQIAALDNQGETLCFADLSLVITQPSGAESTYTTQDGTIKRSNVCGENNVTDNPDYFLYKDFLQQGTYTFHLTNLNTGNTISDSVVVSPDQSAFVVERIGATRINPFLSQYTMHFKVTAQQKFNGDITELVPNTFVMSDATPNDLSHVENDSADTKKIVWHVNMQAGETMDLQYTYQAPFVSPELFLLGPLQIAESNGNVVYQEARQWQIASDAACSATATGNWEDGTKWSGCTGASGVPAATDTVTIPSGVTITSNQNNTVAGITFGAAAATNAVTIAAGTLTVNGNVSIPATTAAVTSGINVGANGLIVTGTMSITGGSVANGNSQLTISTGTTTIMNGITFAGGATHALVTFTGAGSLTMAGGSLSTGGTVTTATGCTIAFTGSADQNLGAYTLRHLTINKPSGAVVLTGGITISASSNLTITNGRLETGANAISGNTSALMSMAAGTSLVLGTTTSTTAIAFPSAFTAANISLNASSTVVYASNIAQTISNTPTYGNLTLTTGATTVVKTAGGALTVNGDLTTSGPVQFALGTSLTHTFKGNWVINSTHATPITFTTASTINFNTPTTPASTGISGSASAVITLNAVNINNTSGFTSSHNFSVSGAMTIASGVTFTPTASTVISGTGSLTGSGKAQVTRATGTTDFTGQYSMTTKTYTNLTIDYAGAGAQQVNAVAYGNLLISNTAATCTLAAATSGITGTTTVNTGATLNTSTFALTTGGHLDVDGTITGSGLVTMNAAKNLDGLGKITNALTMSAAVTILPTANLTIYGTITVSGNTTVVTNNGTINSYSTTGVTGSGNGSTWTNATNSTLNITAATLMPTGTLSLSGTPNTVGYVSTTTTQTVKNVAYSNLYFGNTGQSASASANVTVSGTLTIASGTYNAATFTTTVTGVTTVSGGTYLTSTGKQTLSSNLSFTSGTITASTGAIVIGGNFSSAGTFSGSTGTLDVGGNFTMSAGTFTAPSLFIVGGTFTQSSGTFNPGSSNIILESQTSQSLTVPSTTSFNDLTISDGLAGYWKLDETSGTTGFDSSGYGNNLTYTGTPTSDTSVPTMNFQDSRSYLFSGTAQYGITSGTGNDSNLDPGTGDISVSAWVKYTTIPASTNYGGIAGKGYLGTMVGYGIYEGPASDKPGKISFQIRNGSTVVFADSNAALNDGQWHHVLGVATRNSATGAKLYIDGILQTIQGDTTVLNGVNMTNTLGFAVGERSNGSAGLYFPGNIDDVRVYKRALGQTEATALAAGQHPGTSVATVTLTQPLNINDALYLNSGTLDVSSSNCSGSPCTVSIANGWYNYGGLFTPRTGLVRLGIACDGAMSLNSAGVPFYNVATTIGVACSPLTSYDAFNVGGTLTQSASGTFVASSTTVTGLATLSVGTYSAGSATQTFNGGLTISGATFTGSTGTVDVNGALTLSSGTLTGPASMTVSGDWNRTGGTFTHNNGTVTFDGTGAQTIKSDNTWYGLSVTASTPRTVSFESTKTQTIAANGILSFIGTLGNNLTLAPLTASTPWKLAVSTTGVAQTINYTSVSYSDASGITNFNKQIRAFGGNTDGGNNTNWLFNGSETLANHTVGQVTDQFQNNETATTSTFYRFALTNTDETSSTTLTVDLSSISGIVTGDITNAKLYLDSNNNGILDASESSGGSSSFIVATSSPYQSLEIAEDQANHVMYSVGGPYIFRCASSCSTSSNWSVVMASSTNNFMALTYDSANSVLYASELNTERTFRCATSTGCDTSAKWIQVNNLTGSFGAQSATYMTGRILLGSYGASGAQIVHCATSTGCSAPGNWASYVVGSSANEYMDDLVVDTGNSVVYGITDYNKIYRCPISSNCDAATDWTLSTTTAGVTQNGDGDMTYDATNQVLYAVNAAGIFRCPTSTACDTGSDWTLVKSGGFKQIEANTVTGIIYADDPSGSAFMLACAMSSGCDTASDWTTTASGPATSLGFTDIYIVSSTGETYAGASDTKIYYNSGSSSGGGIYGTPSISGSTGTISFTSTSTVAIGTNNYLLQATVSNISAGDTMTISLSTSKIISYGTDSANHFTVTGSATNVTHVADGSTVTCDTPDPVVTFSGLDLTGVYTAPKTATTTMSCASASGCTLSVSSTGDTVNPGLYKSSGTTYLIPSLTTLLSAGTDGYGIQAATTTAGSGGLVTINSTYNVSGNNVGGLTIAGSTLATSNAAITSREVVVTYKAAVSASAVGGTYNDITTYSCVAN